METFAVQFNGRIRMHMFDSFESSIFILHIHFGGVQGVFGVISLAKIGGNGSMPSIVFADFKFDI